MAAPEAVTNHSSWEHTDANSQPYFFSSLLLSLNYGVGCQSRMLSLVHWSLARHRPQTVGAALKCLLYSQGLMLNKLLFQCQIHAQILRQSLSRRRQSQKLPGDFLINSAPLHFIVMDTEFAAHHVHQTETTFFAFVTATSKQISDFCLHLYFVGFLKSPYFPLPYSIFLLALSLL